MIIPSGTMSYVIAFALLNHNVLQAPNFRVRVKTDSLGI